MPLQFYYNFYPAMPIWDLSVKTPNAPYPFNNLFNFNKNYADLFNYSKIESTTDNTTSTSRETNISAGKGNGKAVLNLAMSYVGKVNSDAEGNRLFSPAEYKKHKSWGWCLDFATYCASHSNPNFPKSLVMSYPPAFRDKADKMGAYLKFPASDKVNWAVTNIKPGDILLKTGQWS